MASLVVTIDVAESKQYLLDTVVRGQGQTKETINGIVNLLGGISGGAHNGRVLTNLGTRAQGTLNVGAGNTSVPTNTVTVASQVLTCVASAPAGNQWVVGFDANQTALNIAAAINASTGCNDKVSARAVGSVVFVDSHYPGTAGNAFTLASSAAAITASGATLAGGTLEASLVFSVGR